MDRLMDHVWSNFRFSNTRSPKKSSEPKRCEDVFQTSALKNMVSACFINWPTDVLRWKMKKWKVKWTRHRMAALWVFFPPALGPSRLKRGCGPSRQEVQDFCFFLEDPGGPIVNRNEWPVSSMGLVYFSTFGCFFMVNVVKYTIHGWYGW